jgi:predicted permease
LGIGANTAIFSLLYQAVLQSLPVERPEELVALSYPGEFKGGRSSSGNSGGMDSIFSYRMFRELERNAQGVTGIAGFRQFDANLAFRNQTIDGSVMVVSGKYFPILGVKPHIGRLIEAEDDAHGGGRPVAVLSNGYWQTRLGGTTDILNQPLRVNGNIFTIVGVTARGFTGTTFGDQPNVFVPLSFKPSITPGWDGTDRWNDHWMYLFARLQPGVTTEQAEAALNVPYHAAVQEQLAGDTSMRRERRERFQKSKLTLSDGRHGQSSEREQSRTPLLILMAATGLVLLIAIANTANLLLARAAQRRKELAIRTALGSGRLGIMKQMLTEAMLLSAGGAVAGLICAAWGLDLLVASLTGNSGPSEQISTALQWPVLLFAMGISMLSGLLCGLYPAWDASRGAVGDALKDQSGQVSGSVGAARVRKVLVCAQVMVSAILLVPTGLFMKSLVNLSNVDLGLKTENVITFRISPELSGYKPAQSRALFERAEEQLAGMPGATNVTASLVPLISGSNWGNNLTVEGFSRDPNADTHSMFNVVGPGYFGMLGVPLLAGREFTERDTLGAPKVAVVNEQFAKHFFGNQNPIGRKLARGAGDVTLDIEIVGVVRDSHYAGVKQSPPKVYFTPWRQHEDIGTMSFYVRTALPTSQMIAQTRQVMSSLDSDLPLENMRTLDEQVRANIRSDRLVLQLSGIFATLATLLAMLGLYGVMAYSVTRRTREIGIRLALGAPRGRIRSMVFRELLIILAAGLAAGIPAAIALARLTESQLFGVESFDAAVVGGVIVALTVAALFAGYLPARRATRIDPMIALRYE